MSDQPSWLRIALGAGVGFLCGVLLIVVLAVTSGSDDQPARPTTTARTATVASIPVPDVVGLRLDVARDELEGEGFAVERTGGGLFGVVVESSWQVRSQTPPAGTRVARGATVELFVARP